MDGSALDDLELVVDERGSIFVEVLRVSLQGLVPDSLGVAEPQVDAVGDELEAEGAVDAF